MPVNLTEPDNLLPVPGVRLGAAAAGIKYQDRDDIAVMLLDDGSVVSGVFTQSHFRAPPVDIAQENVARGGIRALLINSGNANAATGAVGAADARALCGHLAAAEGLPAEAVLPFSTGVIGERLPVADMLEPVESACAAATADGWLGAARAIMTTDTVPKAMSLQAPVGGVTVTATGIAKGAGMIKPDMATMLAFVCCDAAVAPGVLDDVTRRVADRSLNRITVDGDTSTNDSFIVAATGCAGNRVIDGDDETAAAALTELLATVAEHLAQGIVRDAEGATKFVTVRVQGGATSADCLEVAYTVAESPLLKTALFAGDPNWGRICMAIGRAKVDVLDPNKVSVDLGGVPIARGGMIADRYVEADAARVMARDEYDIVIDLGVGDAVEVVWTSDLSYEYVRINAEYRT